MPLENEVVAHLASSSTFGLLPVPTLRRIAPVFQSETIGPGATLGREGEVDDVFRMVVEGAIALDRKGTDGKPRHTATLGYGEVLGERGVFAGLPRDTSAVTLQPTEVLAADRDALWGIIGGDIATLDHLVLPDAVRRRMVLPTAGAADLGERTVAVYRRHWSALAANLVLPIALAVGSLALAGTVAGFVESAVQSLVLAAVGLVVPITAVAYAYLDYAYDVLIVTNRRVIHVDRVPLVRSRRAEAPLVRVQDVQVVVPGLTARSLGFGTLLIQTAGVSGSIRFASLPNPEGVRATLFGLVEHATVDARREHTNWIAARLAPAFAGTETVVPLPGVGEPLAEADGSRGRTLPQAVAHRIAGWLPRMRIEADNGVVTWRKHWWVLVRSTGLVAAATAASFAAWARTVAVGGPLPARAWLAAAAVLGAWAVYRYEDWRNDLYVLTDEHIVDIERRPFGLHEDRRQARLTQIQDIRHVVPNPLATMLNFGSVMVETAATTGSFTFDHVHDPASVQEEIFARIELLRTAEERSASERRGDELAEWFRAYHALARTTGYGEVNKTLASPEGIG